MSSKQLLVIILALFSLAAVQSLFHPFKTIPLAGAESIPDSKPFTADHWMSLDWQKRAEQRAKKTFGFRPHFVRFYNQVLFSFFDEINPQVIAKGDTLFERGYLPAINGEDYLGDEQIVLKIDSLRQFQAALNKKGKELFIMLAPNKWRSFQAYDSLGAKTNYDAFMNSFRKGGFNVIDCLAYFERHASTSPYPLHSKQGTHWSIYGAYVSATLLQEQLNRHQIETPKMLIDSLEIAAPRNTDKDLRDLLNVMLPPNKEQLAYPQLKFEGNTKPKALIIGDSYYWSYYYLGIHQGLFDAQSPFFYYNKSKVYNDVNTKEPLTDDQRQNALDSVDIVIFMMSEPSLKWFGYGVF